MNKKSIKLAEAVLNELAVIGKDYSTNKKTFDEAFKKALPTWETKASKKGFKPVSVKEMEQGLGQSAFGGNKIEMLEKLNIVKVGKWTLVVGNTRVSGDGTAYSYNKRGVVNTCLVLVAKPNGKVAFRGFPFRRFMNWNSTKVK